MSIKILAVDDSETVRMTVKKILESNGFKIIEAEDGLEATTRLKEHPDIQLVICDVNMPKVDGLTFCEELRKTDQFKKLPVLMLTTQTNPELKARGKAAGVLAWITKPMHSEKLLHAVKVLTEGKT
jgi:two-component system chemotaxis response regulator CheY